MHRTLKMAWRFLRIDWRSGELQLLFLSLLLAVTIVTGLTAFIERLEVMLAGESSQFLAADRVLSSPRPINTAWLLEAETLGLKRAELINFQSMLYVNDEPLLVSIKAASNNYPLIGSVKIRDTDLSSTYSVTSGPEKGEIWVQKRVLQQLVININDQVFIGDAPLRISKVLVSEPDRGVGFISMGPRVLMHLDDVPATGVITQGSRLSYAYLFAASTARIKIFEQWLLPQLSDSEKWLDLENSQPTVAVALQRAKTFFLLASSIVIVLAVIAVAMASTRYCQRHIKHIAVLKTLGATSSHIFNIYSVIFTLLFLAVVLIGWGLAFILQQLILTEAAAELEVALPSLSLFPFALGAVTALISLLAFSVPPLLRLKGIPAVHIFRQSMQQSLFFTPASLLIALLGLLVLLLLFTQQLWLSLLLLLALLLLTAVIALPAILILKKIPKNTIKAGHWWSLAVSNMRRRLVSNALQLALFSISLMLLVVLLGLKNNLFHQWQNQLSYDTPNFFIVNLKDAEVASVTHWLSAKASNAEHIYPMIRGRLIKINDIAVREQVSKEDFKRSGADRELNLSWSSVLPSDNTLVEGQWFDPLNADTALPQVSVESQLAQKLNIRLGDQLDFMIAGETISANVSSLRNVEWDRMRPNFYMLLEKPSLERFPKTFMTSFYLPEADHDEIAGLLKQVPTAIVIEVDSLIKQIRSIIEHVSLALQVVLVFVFIGSMLVMTTVVQHSLDARKKENTVIRALGGSKALIVGSLISEFVFLGFLAGVLATIAAEIILLGVQKWVMALPLALHPDIWYLAPTLGVCIVGSAGYIAVRNVINVVPMQLLREQ